MRLRPLGIQMNSHQFSGFLRPTECSAPLTGVFLTHKSDSRLGLQRCSPCLYMAASRESIAFMKTVFVRFTNSCSAIPRKTV